jgi:hypothetical protein
VKRRPLGREHNIKIDLKNWSVNVWIGFTWLRIGAGGRFL